MQGRFEIFTLTSSFVVSGEMVTRCYNGLLSVSLANSDGQVYGGIAEQLLEFIVVVSIIFSFIKPGSVYVFVILEA